MVDIEKFRTEEECEELFERSATNMCSFQHDGEPFGEPLPPCSGDVKVYYFPRRHVFWAFCSNGANWNRGRDHKAIVVKA